MNTILIVDDDATLRTALARYLTHRKFAVEQAASGEEALGLFLSKPADVVVSDILMPGMDGFEFCRQLRGCQQGQLVSFIFLTSRGDIEDRIFGHSLGADDYLTKPFEPRELLAKIEAQLERSRRVQIEIDRLLTKQTLAAVAEDASEPLTPLPLTPAEIKVFWEVVQGYTNRQIGDRLFISPRTVQTHLSNILSKLNLENRSQLVRYAFEQGYQMPTPTMSPVAIALTPEEYPEIVSPPSA
jgi:DNA-binding NarL/FixJ family response regulator